MTRTIVTGVDGSETATAAAHRAAALAWALGARLHVISAYEKFEVERVGHGGDQFEFSTAKDAEEVAESVAATLRAEHPQLELSTASVKGKPAEALVRTAETMDATLIVVGNKRVQGLTRVLGSVANHVTANAPCDVYVAHTHTKD